MLLKLLCVLCHSASATLYLSADPAFLKLRRVAKLERSQGSNKGLSTQAHAVPNAPLQPPPSVPSNSDYRSHANVSVPLGPSANPRTLSRYTAGMLLQTQASYTGPVHNYNTFGNAGLPPAFSVQAQRSFSSLLGARRPIKAMRPAVPKYKPLGNKISLAETSEYALQLTETIR